MARIGFVMDSEYEDSEFQKPFDALRAAGHECRILGLVKGARLVGKRGTSGTRVEEEVAAADPHEFEALVLPGGHSPDRLRVSDAPGAFIRRFAEAGGLIAAICHGPQLLIDAELVRGKNVASWPSVRVDLLNAGA